MSGKVIATKEKLALVNPENINLMNDFCLYLESIQRSPGTIAGYRGDLNIVFVYLLDYCGNKVFSKMTKREIVRFQNWLQQEHGNSPARIRRIKSTMGSLSNYIEAVLDEEEEYKNFKPIVHKIADPEARKVKELTIWNGGELEQLLKELTLSGKYERACALALAMYSGRRKSELLRFRVSDFDDSCLVCNGMLYRTAEPIKTKGRALGSYIYCYTYAKGFQPYLKAWMKQREAKGIESEWLFPQISNPSEPLHIGTMNKWAVIFSDMTGKNFYWHSLRHYFVTALAKDGVPDYIIQKIIGWKSSDMVSIYKDISAEEQISDWFSDGRIGKAG